MRAEFRAGRTGSPIAARAPSIGKSMAAGEAFALYQILRSSQWDICSVIVALPGKYAILLRRCSRSGSEKLELRAW
jgi:hypothetical protein